MAGRSLSRARRGAIAALSAALVAAVACVPLLSHSTGTSRVVVAPAVTSPARLAPALPVVPALPASPAPPAPDRATPTPAARTSAATPTVQPSRRATSSRAAAVSHAPAAASTHPAPPAAPALLVTRLHDVGSARQVISVTADGYGTSYATFRAFTRTSAGWTQTFGPWTARIGTRGFAPAGAKKEGDGRTPTGAYGFQYFFGVQPNPGVRYAYRVVTGSYIVWDDDPASPNYNLWVDTRTTDAGANPEPMYHLPVYDYGAVIGYNTARTPGLGSAIFLHQNGSGSTAGCVSLPQSELLAVLRWLDPSASPRIVLGVTSAVAS
ncbi:MAG TPA: L,D-transpeptidase family protein [Mycobacteriales bacterium]|nr:L,D-transpeptidase family protein [Mycobacteriales bacterium]